MITFSKKNKKKSGKIHHTVKYGDELFKLWGCSVVKDSAVQIQAVNSVRKVSHTPISHQDNDPKHSQINTRNTVPSSYLMDLNPSQTLGSEVETAVNKHKSECPRFLSLLQEDYKLGLNE